MRSTACFSSYQPCYTDITHCWVLTLLGEFRCLWHCIISICITLLLLLLCDGTVLAHTRHTCRRRWNDTVQARSCSSSWHGNGNRRMNTAQCFRYVPSTVCISNTHSITVNIIDVWQKCSHTSTSIDISWRKYERRDYDDSKLHTAFQKLMLLLSTLVDSNKTSELNNF